MVEEVLQRNANVHVTVRVPTSLADGRGDAREAFERVWSRLPPFEGENSFCALDQDGGVFVKGQEFRWHRGPATLVHARRLVRETEFLRRMHAADVPVPEVLAHGVETRLGVPVRSFVVLRHLAGTRDLREVLRQTSPDERTEIWQPIGETVAALHATRLFHRDLTARNVLLHRVDGAVRVHLIDCPRAEVGWFGPRTAFLRRADLFRLGRSVLKCGGSREEVRRLLVAAGCERTAEHFRVVCRSAEEDGSRSLRTKLWIAFGT